MSFWNVYFNVQTLGRILIWVLKIIILIDGCVYLRSVHVTGAFCSWIKGSDKKFIKDYRTRIPYGRVTEDFINSSALVGRVTGGPYGCSRKGTAMIVSTHRFVFFTSPLYENLKKIKNICSGGIVQMGC